jgi:predicted anti-sigma-YlaC factor YlaD
MDCQKVKSSLIDHFYKELGFEISNAVHEHLDNCQSCQTLYNKMSVILSSTRLNAELIPNEFLATRIIAKLDNKQHDSSRVRMLQYFLRPALVISLVILGIFAGIKISNSYSESLSNNLTINNNNNLTTQFASENFLTTPNDEFIEMYLNDKK